MKVVVCAKQVPDPEYFDKVTLDPKTNTIVRSGIPLIMNPPDRHALEEALRIREAVGGEVITLSMGPPQTAEMLELALAMGSDSAVLLSDPEFAGSDTLATALSLARAVERIGAVDLILCGDRSVDGCTGQVPAQLAEFLGVPHVARAEKVERVDNTRLRVCSKRDWGVAIFAMRLPAVVSVTCRINTWRLPTVAGIMSVASKPVTVWTARDLGLSGYVGLAHSPTKVVGITQLATERKGFIVEGDETGIRQAVRRLRELGAL